MDQTWDITFRYCIRTNGGIRFPPRTIRASIDCTLKNILSFKSIVEFVGEPRHLFRAINWNLISIVAKYSGIFSIHRHFHKRIESYIFRIIRFYSTKRSWRYTWIFLWRGRILKKVKITGWTKFQIRVPINKTREKYTIKILAFESNVWMDVEWTGPAHRSIARGSTNKEMK